MIYYIKTMWLIHETSLSKLKTILQDGYIKPSSENIFMSVLFDDISIVGKGTRSDILLIFPIDILAKYDVSHWSPEWYGEHVEQSIKYDKTKSPLENVKIWDSVFHKVRTKVQDYIYRNRSQNEVLFNEKIPISEVAYIYVVQKVNPGFEVPKRVDTKQKLNKLLYK